MKSIRQILKELFIKIKCYMCCRSKCSIQVGQENTHNIKTTEV